MTAGVKAGDERNFARSLNDMNAGRAIRARMHRSEGFVLKGVDVEVSEGIVLLSGNVPRTEDRIEAERIAWSADRIQQVGNEVRIKAKQGKVRNAKDGVLHQKIRTKFIANKNVKARNYNIEVHDATVYIMGVARSEHELALAAHIASTTKGTREVVSYVRINGDTASQMVSGPGYNGQPSIASSQYSGAAIGSGSTSGAIPYRPLLTAPAAPQLSAPTQGLAQGAIPSDEPYYLDPQTGERVEIPEGVTPIPYVPDTGIGSLGHGGTAPQNYQGSGVLPTGY